MGMEGFSAENAQKSQAPPFPTPRIVGEKVYGQEAISEQKRCRILKSITLKENRYCRRVLCRWEQVSERCLVQET